MEIIINQDRQKLGERATELLVRELNRTIKAKKTAVLGIPGGKSVPIVFDLLKNVRSVDWNAVHIFMVDERLVPLDHPESNFRQAQTHFLDDLVAKKVIPKSNLHPFTFDPKKPDGSIANYAAHIRSVGGKFDVVLLSSGEDGHVAGLFPHHNSLANKSESFVLMDDSPKPPSKRMSISKHMLLQADAAVLLFLGEGKRPAFVKFVDETLDFNACPAKLVAALKESYVLTDIMPRG